MCLAKAYVHSPAGSEASAESGESVDGLLVMENVTQVDVDGDRVHLKSLLGDKETVQGRVASIDFSEGRLVLQSAT